ncbi:MAG: AMP-binding protein, partial [Actinobacteria bacterium]|nr:AMP-binding protein [Actinomycetota bacterium]
EMFTEHCLAVGATEKLPCPLRLVMMSGDWIPVTLPDRIRNFLPDAAIWSLGGATEAAIWSICYPVAKVDPSWTSIPYGYPMRNQRFHVLDEMLRPRPTWVPGQLYIAGAGLARGYLNDEAKTQAVFIQHPETGERLYRTGDLGRYLPDGTIEFLGREDSQVKVAGYRIELGDVEAALSQCPGVRAAVAAVDSTATGKRLVGYVVTDAPPETGAGSVSQRVITAARGKLPSYMVPSVVVVMDELPLTANGKVNRAALPAPDPAGTGGTSGVLPRDHVEAGLAAIWGGFFPGTDIGVADSFFDLGGDSLLAVRLMARIEQDFGRRLPVSILFARPTVGELADVLRENADPGLPGRDAVVPVRPAAAVRGDGKADGWPPLFFIHPVGGDVLCYADLAQRLGPDLPFYAIQTPDVTRPLDSVPEMAEHYAKEALAAVPDGPFMIGGWSMGGVVAIEAARQLAQLGRQPDLVIAVDLLEPPGGTDHAPLDEPELLAWFGADLAGIAGVDWRPSAELFRTAGGRAAVPELHRQLADHGILSADIDPATLNRVVERFIRNATALRNHQPQPYSGTVRLLRAADGGATEQTTRAWLGLLPGDSAAIEVPGDHYTVMREPGLAATIRRTFSRDSSS